jgi:MFS family permease
MVGRPAVIELLGYDSEEAKTNEGVGVWFNVVIAGFLIGAATGGVLFGWLGDRIGRVRAMALSVFTYAVFTGLCGLAGGVGQLLVLRFIASLGMGGEWSLGVALVMEVWPNRSRAFMAGLIGAAANLGYMLVGFVGLAVAQFISSDSWRIVMIVGAAPALLTFFIRLYVPESKRWEEERSKGATSSWATQDLLGVLLGTLGPVLIVIVWLWEGWPGMPTGVLATIRITATFLGIAVAARGFLYPVFRYLRREEGGAVVPKWRHPTIRHMLFGASLSGVALLGTWGAAQQVPSWAHQLTGAERSAGIERYAKEYAQIWLAVGATVGSILAAMMSDWFGRRKAYCLLCLLSIIAVVVQFQTNRTYDGRFLLCTFFLGACTASFYGWLPLYLPELFRTNVRATGQGFGYNFGRILAAIGTLNAATLFGVPNSKVLGVEVAGGHPLACTAMSAIYVVGIMIIWLGPETRGKPLPE